MTYEYKTVGTITTNKLTKVSDAIVASDNGSLGDFKDGANGSTEDYDYDANGNLILDNNKSISSITYNHLNLPSVITVDGKGTISYTYNAAGNKLKKETVDNTGTKSIATTTRYLSGVIYESKSTSPANTPNDDYTNRLQFIPHEEGRIRPIYGNSATPNAITDLAFDYFLKDHLGNVWMVLTDEKKTDKYPAVTMELVHAALEEELYANINTTRSDKPAGYPSDTFTNLNAKVARLKAATGSQKIGPSITGATQFLNNQSYTSSKPKAYLNWILFDEQFKLLTTSWIFRSKLSHHSGESEPLKNMGFFCSFFDIK